MKLFWIEWIIHYSY